MKTIENISPVFERIIRKGLESALAHTIIPIFQAEINLFFEEDTVFVLFSRLNTYTKKNQVLLFEVKSNESSYLLNSINQIIDDLDLFGEDSKKRDTIEIYKQVIAFCKKNDFDCSDFKSALDKIL